MKKYPFLRAFRLASLIFCLAQNALAHDGWIEISPWIAEKGQPVTVALMHGNHSNEHKSFRLAGKWDPEFTKLMVIDPSGKIHDLTSGIVDLGEDPEKTGPKGPKGFHVAQFTPKVGGVYVVLARQERVLQHGTGPKFRSVRNARSAFAVLSSPTILMAKKVKGFDRTFALENVLEIVPLTNPLGVMKEGSVTLQVRYKGNPSPGKTLTLLRKIDGPTSAQDFTTDEQGRVRFAAGPADVYLARVKFDEEGERTERQFEKSSYEATYVLQVFNRP